MIRIVFEKIVSSPIKSIVNERKNTQMYLRRTEIDKEFPDDIGKDNFIIAIKTSSRSLWRNCVWHVNACSLRKGMEVKI